jgi:hypothetical protein
MNEDLTGDSNEPATRGDLRNLALRVELRVMKTETSLLAQVSTTEVLLKDYINKAGSKFVAVSTTITVSVMTLVSGLLAYLITSSM